MGIMSLADLASTLTPDHLPKPAARSPDRGSEGWLEFDVLYAHAGQLELWEQYARFSSQGDAHVGH